MSDPIETAVIGAGTIGQRHARLLNEHHRTNLRAVIDLDATRAEAVSDQYNASVGGTNAEKILVKESIDAAIVATPESAHVAPTEAALSNDCHVLLEKPIADTEADARRIGKLADDADSTLMIAYCCRFDSEYASLKSRIETGDFGDPLGIQAARIASINSYERVGDWTHPVYYLAVHDIDMMRWYLNAEVTQLCSYATQLPDDRDTPAIISTTMTFDNGVVGTLETNWARVAKHPLHLTQELRLTGTNGYSRLVVQDDDVPVSTVDGFEFATTSESHGRLQDMYRFQLDQFLACLEDDRDPLVTWEDGLHSLRVANAIRKSIETDSPVTL